MDDVNKSDAADTQAGAQWYNQPKKVYILCILYCAERASIYGIRYGLVLWLVQTWGLLDAKATALFGAFTFFIFASHAVAGNIADTGWGFIKTGRLGLVILAVGYGLFGHIFEAAQNLSSNSIGILGLALALVAAGTGLVRISCFNLVGLQYKRDDPQSAVAYTLYYWLESIGLTLAAVIAGTIVPMFGYQVTFSISAVLFLSVFAASWMIKLVPHEDDAAAAEDVKGQLTFRDAGRPGAGVRFRSFLMTAAMVAVFFGFALAPGYVWLLVILAFAYALFFVARHRSVFAASDIGRTEVRAFLLLTLFSVIYSILLEQQMSSVLLFADRFVNLEIFGFRLGASNVLGLNPITICVTTPIIAAVIAAYAARGKPICWSSQYALAFILVAGSFLILMSGALGMGDGAKVALPILMVSICMAAVGDALIFPRAFVALSRVSPGPIRGSVSGLWFLFSAVAGYLGGWVAGLSTSTLEVGTGETAQLSSYIRFFGFVGTATFALAALLWFWRRWFSGSDDDAQTDQSAVNQEARVDA